jgi:hypothetical protein
MAQAKVKFISIRINETEAAAIEAAHTREGVNETQFARQSVLDAAMSGTPAKLSVGEARIAAVALIEKAARLLKSAGA